MVRISAASAPPASMLAKNRSILRRLKSLAVSITIATVSALEKAAFLVPIVSLVESTGELYSTVLRRRTPSMSLKASE